MTAEYVTRAIVRELMETQERAFKQTIELYTDSVREEVKSKKENCRRSKDKPDVFSKRH